MILAIDPGSEKCGLAIFDDAGNLLEKRIVKTSEALAEINKYAPSKIILGDGTSSKTFKNFLNVVVVSEKNSTLEARQMYLKDHPPRGILRLLPQSLLFPGKPIDDYAAVVLGRRYFRN